MMKVRGIRLGKILCSTVAILASIVLAANAGPLRLGDEGVTIDGGSMGAFTLAYPKIAAIAGPGEHETAMEQPVAVQATPSAWCVPGTPSIR